MRVINKCKRLDGLLLIAMLAALSVHLLFIFLPHYLADESFYTTIPYRLLNGDSLIKDEWHLSQLASFFSYLPVSFWLKIKGSADGLIVFLRLLYLAIHTAAAAGIYCLFRNYKHWAIAAALIYYLQTPYKIYAISYNSMFALFLLLFCVSLYLIYRRRSDLLCFISGVFYAACCIGNPPFVITLLLYPFMNGFLKAHGSNPSGEGQQEKLQSREEEADPPKKTDCEKKRGQLSGNHTVFFLLGIVSVAAAGLVFFFYTGGELSSIAINLRAMLDSSEYGIVSGTALSKIRKILRALNSLTLNCPYIFLLFFLVFFSDSKRKQNLHRLLYLLAVIPLSVLCILGMRFSSDIDDTLLSSLPCALLSLVCYSLTENRNKPLFVCMWCPCAIAALINLFISNTLLSASGFVLAAGNVAGVFFVHDLLREMCSAEQAEKTHTRGETKTGIIRGAARIAVCAVLGLQIILYVYIIQFGQPIPERPVIVRDGPQAGMIMSEESDEYYRASLGDLDLIRSRSSADDPVLVVSYQSWMYLYLQRPIASYTAWYDARIDSDSLSDYYALNPNKIPKYIYIVYSDDIAPLGIHVDNIRSCTDTIDLMFDYTSEELSNGLLLTVSEYHGP